MRTSTENGAAGVLPAALNVSWPIMLSYVAIGLPCGMLVAKAGMSPAMSFLLAVALLTSSGQFMVGNLWLAGVPVASIVASVVAVSSRFALYSASIAPYLKGASRAKTAAISATLTEEAYGISLAKLAAGDGWTTSHALALNLVLVLTRGVSCAVGAAIGSAIDIPTAVVSFMVTALFVFLLRCQLTVRPNVVAALTAAVAVVALKLAGLASVAILVAALVGVACGLVAFAIGSPAAPASTADAASTAASAASPATPAAGKDGDAEWPPR